MIGAAMKLVFLLFILLQNQNSTTTPPTPPTTGDQVKRSISSTETEAVKRAPEVGSQRNQNIQINLIDNNALNERLGREGIQATPPRDFTAVRSDYASEFGGMGRNIDIVSPDRRSQ